MAKIHYGLILNVIR